MVKRVWKFLVRTFWTLIVLGIIGALIVAYMHRQDFQDYFAAQDFTPSSRVQQVVNDLSLTDSGRRVFLATHPSIEGRESFNEHCERTDHDSGGHLLGCYVDDTIFLFHVDDERLNGVIEVTAAHELLHATYARLSQPERERLAQRLQETFLELLPAYPQLEERMAVYEHLSASRFSNELHSVLGTEVRELPDWLEAHYAKWFENRAQIVDYFESYNDVFLSLQEEAESLQERLESLRLEIEEDSNNYTAEVERFNEEWRDFRARNEAFEFSDRPDEFYRLIGVFDERRTMLDTWRSNLEDRVNEHEDLRLQLEALGDLSTELNEKIDSEFIPPVDADSV